MSTELEKLKLEERELENKIQEGDEKIDTLRAKIETSEREFNQELTKKQEELTEGKEKCTEIFDNALGMLEEKKQEDYNTIITNANIQYNPIEEKIQQDYIYDLGLLGLAPQKRKIGIFERKTQKDINNNAAEKKYEESKTELEKKRNLELEQALQGRNATIEEGKRRIDIIHKKKIDTIQKERALCERQLRGITSEIENITHTYNVDTAKNNKSIQFITRQMDGMRKDLSRIQDKLYPEEKAERNAAEKARKNEERIKQEQKPTMVNASTTTPTTASIVRNRPISKRKTPTRLEMNNENYNENENEEKYNEEAGEPGIIPKRINKNRKSLTQTPHQVPKQMSQRRPQLRQQLQNDFNSDRRQLTQRRLKQRLQFSSEIPRRRPQFSNKRPSRVQTQRRPQGLQNTSLINLRHKKIADKLGKGFLRRGIINARYKLAKSRTKRRSNTGDYEKAIGYTIKKERALCGYNSPYIGKNTVKKSIVYNRNTGKNINCTKFGKVR